MSEPLDLDAIEARWSGDGGMGNGRSADDYTDAGCRIFAEYAFDEVPALIARVRELEPRVLEGDWETVRDALDALPLGTVIKWSDDLGYSAAIKCPNVMGDARWFEAGVRNPRSSESIARDETPIEVIA